MEYRKDCTPEDAGAIARLFFAGFVEVKTGLRHPAQPGADHPRGFFRPRRLHHRARGGELRGFALLDFGGRCLFKLGLKHFLKEYGLVEGLRRGFLGALLNAGSHKGAFLLDVLAVDAGCRGAGHRQPPAGGDRGGSPAAGLHFGDARRGGREPAGQEALRERGLREGQTPPAPLLPQGLRHLRLHPYGEAPRHGRLTTPPAPYIILTSQYNKHFL